MGHQLRKHCMVQLHNIFMLPLNYFLLVSFVPPPTPYPGDVTGDASFSLTLLHHKFSQHCNKLCARAGLRAKQILRSFRSKCPTVLTRAYVTFVRPLLEYGSQIWSPRL